MQLLINTKYSNQKRSVFDGVGGALEEHKGNSEKKVGEAENFLNFSADYFLRWSCPDECWRTKFRTWRR